jgi:hypothetical protein
LQDLAGRTSPLSNFVVVALNDDPATGESVDLSGLLAGDYNGNGTVDSVDYSLWQQSFADLGDGMFADGNGDNVINSADYVVWRKNLGATIPGSGTGAMAEAIEAVTMSDSSVTPSVVARERAVDSVVALLSDEPLQGWQARSEKQSHKSLVFRPHFIDASARRSLEDVLLKLDATLVRGAARERAFEIADKDGLELNSDDIANRRFEMALAFEALEINSRL